jgi:ABC-type lipoprotein export system ATPase subunit
LFQKICFEQGTTIVVVTHDAELAALADRTINLQDGALL